MPVPYMVAKGPAMLSFIVAKIEEKTGRTTSDPKDVHSIDEG